MTIGRHDARAAFTAADVDAIAVANGDTHQAWSGQSIRLDNGGSVVLPDVSGGWLRVSPPSGVAWDATISGGPQVITTLPMPPMPLDVDEIEFTLPAGAVSWDLKARREPQDVITGTFSGDNVTVTFTLTHNLGTGHPSSVSLIHVPSSTYLGPGNIDILNAQSNSIDVEFNTAPTPADSYIWKVVG